MEKGVHAVGSDNLVGFGRRGVVYIPGVCYSGVLLESKRSEEERSGLFSEIGHEIKRTLHPSQSILSTRLQRKNLVKEI